MKQIKWISSMNKVFPWREPASDLEGVELSALGNETLSLQLAYCMEGEAPGEVTLRVEGGLAEYTSLRSIGLMPSVYPCGTETDGNYIDTRPGLYPDLLRETKKGRVHMIPGQWHSAWAEITLEETLKAGSYTLQAVMLGEDGQEAARCACQVKVCRGKLEEQTLIHTEWFHADCLADYYQVPVWSKEHWDILGRFVELYHKRGMNMILTPVITPPLDIAADGERTTVQLVDITALPSEDAEGGYRYEFDFTRLIQWITLCRQNGIIYFEMAHLYSQWGAKYVPKIMAQTDGKTQRLFAWDEPAVSQGYRAFLAAFLPGLTGVLRAQGLEGKVFFHLSDEPSEEDMEQYLAVKEQTQQYLGGFPVIDALSRYEFYEKGIVRHPIPGTGHVMEFIEKGVPHLWTYYCNAQKEKLSNRFFAMPLARTRILGLQLYKYQIEGFLHWGFNFYNTRFSTAHINPYEVTDAGGHFPSGDSFLVYPGKLGIPEESVRLMALMEAVQDYCACQTLEKYTSRVYVVKLLEDGLETPLTFTQYPRESAYLLKVRERMNREIDRCLNGR